MKVSELIHKLQILDPDLDDEVLVYDETYGRYVAPELSMEWISADDRPTPVTDDYKGATYRAVVIS